MRTRERLMMWLGMAGIGMAIGALVATLSGCQMLAGAGRDLSAASTSPAQVPEPFDPMTGPMECEP